MAYDEDLAERIRNLLAAESGVREKKMFGGLAFLVNGHMAVAASSQGGLLLRVAPEQWDDLLDGTLARPFEMRGREMRGWLRVDGEVLGTDAALEPWVARALTHARALPPKP